MLRFIGSEQNGITETKKHKNDPFLQKWKAQSTSNDRPPKVTERELIREGCLWRSRGDQRSNCHEVIGKMAFMEELQEEKHHVAEAEHTFQHRWGVPFISRGQRRCSELVGRGMELNSGQSWMEVPSCSKHRARVTKGRFTLKHFHTIERPRQSPDLQLLRICSKAWKLLQGFHLVRLTRS